MKKTNDYYRYVITNGAYDGICGADTMAECSEIIANFEKEDREIGGHDEYHVFRLNRTTGERLRKVF